MAGPKDETFTVYYDQKTDTMTVIQSTKLSEIVDTINEATTKCQVSHYDCMYMWICMNVCMYVCMFE